MFTCLLWTTPTSNQIAIPEENPGLHVCLMLIPETARVQRPIQVPPQMQTNQENESIEFN